MNTDFRQFIAKPVVRLEEIASLRAYLEKKYPDQSPEERADMMAQSIYKMLDASMSGLEPQQRDRIRRKMVEQYLIESRQSILKLDILNQVLRLPDLLPDQVVSKAWGWYVMNTGHSILMSEFTDRVTPYLPPRVREAVREQIEKQKELLPQQKPKSPELPEPVIPDTAAPPQPVAAHKQEPTKPVHRKKKYRLAKKYRFTKKGWIAIGSAAVLIALSGYALTIGISHFRNSILFAPVLDPAVELKAESPFRIEPDSGPIGKPEYFRFSSIRTDDLKRYLEAKNSALLNSGYLNQLLTESKETDINPLLLVAILGQEQGYVPREHRYADIMLKNPFNIYGSWETHRIGFDKSLGEACFTINASLAKRTYYEDPFEVINKRYAQDPNWRLGVKLIFLDLMASCMDDPVR